MSTRCKYCGELLKGVAPAEHTCQGWISVKDVELPRDGKEFVGLHGRQMNVKQLISWNTLHKYWQSKGEVITVIGVTHWMAFPDPPEPEA